MNLFGQLGVCTSKRSTTVSDQQQFLSRGDPPGSSSEPAGEAIYRSAQGALGLKAIYRSAQGALGLKAIYRSAQGALGLKAVYRSA